jgi:hypothetical protein
MPLANDSGESMLAHYSHVRLAAKRNQLDALSGRGLSQTDSVGSEPSYDTNRNVAEGIPAEIIEKNGRPEWTRTIDLFRVKEAL